MKLDEIIKERKHINVLEGVDGKCATAEGWESHRDYLRTLLERYSYGKTPKRPTRVTSEVLSVDDIAYAGKVREERVKITLTDENGDFSFEGSLYYPKRFEKPPVFLHIAFRPVPDRYIPVEEITDAGYALFVVVYTDIVNDNHYGDFSDGLAKHFGVGEREPEEWGKIGMWAYGVSTVVDYLMTRDDINRERIALIGHSRLGKTVLWCAAQDERVWAVVSNNSGYGGAASSRHANGEHISDFFRLGSWDWFTETFKDYLDRENEKPYDQSQLLALIAPRILLVNSAEEDRGADPISELITARNASAAWELLGEEGIPNVELPSAPVKLFSGKVGYFLRHGRHFLSREDWSAAIEFLNQYV